MVQPTPDAAPSPECLDAARSAVAGRFAVNDLKHPAVAALAELAAQRLAAGRTPPDPALAGSPCKLPGRPAGRPSPATPAPTGASRHNLLKINPPPLPQVIYELELAIGDPKSSAKDIAAVLGLDPALAAHVLRVVNSAYYGFAARIDTLERAVAVAGLKEISTLAVSLAVGNVFSEPPAGNLVDMTLFWRHSLASGLAARSLARLARRSEPERFFVAGLLHDMGKVLCALAEPELAAAALAQAEDQQLPTFLAERRVFGFDHAELGGNAILKWNLPRSLAEAVGRHHDPETMDLDAGQDVVHLANVVAAGLGFASDARGLVAPLAHLAWKRLGLSTADLGAVAAALDERLDSLCAAFAAGSRSGRPA